MMTDKNTWMLSGNQPDLSSDEAALAFGKGASMMPTLGVAPPHPIVGLTPEDNAALVAEIEQQEQERIKTQ
ncbi:hypothetical protein AB8B21_05785 [Tardiphaga sp. 866_E4_N2_1]|uniref:hypothetical protein n=1 Tax=unclassified Tardiphaga TaxID=2631404 RepID=UPI003F2004B4